MDMRTHPRIGRMEIEESCIIKSRIRTRISQPLQTTREIKNTLTDLDEARMFVDDLSE